MGRTGTKVDSGTSWYFALVSCLHLLLGECSRFNLTGGKCKSENFGSTGEFQCNDVNIIYKPYLPRKL